METAGRQLTVVASGGMAKTKIIKANLQRTRWSVIEDSLFVHVLPVSDTKPHGFPADGEKSAQLAGMNCPCKPRVEIASITALYNKAAIYHNSFQDNERIAEKLNALFV